MTRTITGWLGAALFAAGATAVAIDAQQRVPMRGDIPVAPQGIPPLRVPDAPVTYDTAEGQRITVSPVVRGLANPWSLVWLPNGDMLITERPGRVRLVHNGALDPKPVDGVPPVAASGLAGLMDVVLHPQFASNNWVYLTFTRQVAAGPPPVTTLVIARGRWTGSALADVKDVFVAGPGVNGPARLAFGRDGTMYVTTGAVNGTAAQDPNSLAGKVLRLKDDGTIPTDNPFVGKAGHRAEVFTMGHRSSLGLAVHPGTGEVWQHENGPNGGDKINILKPGANYGWPIVSLGRAYPGNRQSAVFSKDGIEQPVVFWVPSIAVSGIAFYTGDRLAKWKGDVFVGSLRVGEVPGTGHLERILFNEQMEELRRESLLVPLRQRVRDVRQGPDQLLYVLTDDPKDGTLLRIEPAQ
jgi:glucose/arabinose dehydrogenase